MNTEMAQHSHHDPLVAIDPKSGFCASNSIFYSKRPPMPSPANPYLDLTTFVSAQPHRGTTAFIDACSGRRLSFQHFWDSVHTLSNSLSSVLGIRKGHVVLLLSPNSISFPIICLSVVSLGAIISTTNPVNTPREISSQVHDSNPVLAFTTPSLLPKLSDALAKQDIPIVLITTTEQQDHDHSAPNRSVPNRRPIHSLDHLMRMGKMGKRRLVERVGLDDPASLLYSSGTTGKSKGVLSSHRGLITMVHNVLSRVHAESGGAQAQTFIATVPMFHIYGLSWFVAGLVASGSTVVVLPRFNIVEMLEAVGKYRVSYLPIVPPVIVAMINDAEEIKRRYDLGSLKTVLSGGSPLSREVIEEFLGEYPTVKIIQGYGLTETTGLGASTNSVEESRRYGSTGRLASSLEAKLVDPQTGKSLSVNRTGYLNNPEATSSTLTSDGWLKTGDLCYIDDDGFLFVVDRLKELIKYKAYQVAPAELEALLLTPPQIADAAVIPFPDKEVGQFPMAYVVCKQGSRLSDKTVKEFVAKQVAPYKRIRRVAFVEAIPKNPSGKILRKDLIKLATSKL
ncbi:hypothetical protein Syun_005558 [Stephania yunnanensis]|uniref:4-coumarate--CoA ligase n=1 Tax=Stephania yunnanensis TaxID=152371 RepID=A0AAP0L5E6_9MAGN